MSIAISEEALYKKSPQEITSLLYEACINNLEDAIDEIKNKNHMIANMKLQKVNDILWRLGAGINYEAGIIADQLDTLYNFMAGRIVEANFKKDIAIIEEVLEMIIPIAEAWNTALKNKESVEKKAYRQKTLAYEQSVMKEEK